MNVVYSVDSYEYDGHFNYGIFSTLDKAKEQLEIARKELQERADRMNELEDPFCYREKIVVSENGLKIDRMVCWGDDFKESNFLNENGDKFYTLHETVKITEVIIDEFRTRFQVK